MRQFWKRTILAMLLIAAVMGSYAQTGSDSRSATIQIVAVVPSILKLSLDFSSDATAQLTGYIPGPNASAINVSYSKGSRFEIRQGARVDVGNARLFSNMNSSYSVAVYSANNGTLRDPSGKSQVAIQYGLFLGDKYDVARGGAFTFMASGKSTKSGTPLKVALAINDIPSIATSGIYTDQLMFSISAN